MRNVALLTGARPEPRVAVLVDNVSREANLIWTEVAALGHDVQLLVPCPQSSDVDAELRGIRVVPVTSVRPLGRGATKRVDLDLDKVLGEVRPDLLHVHGEPWSLSVLRAVRTGLPTVAHGAETRLRQQRLLPDALRSQLLRWVTPRLAGYVGWSGKAIDQLRPFGLASATPTAVFPGVTPDPLLFHPADRRPSFAEVSMLSVGFVGRLVPEKGVSTLLHAAARMKRKVRVVIVGDGPDRNRLEHIASRLAAQVTFMGVQERQTVAKILREMDVLVVPSLETSRVAEQFGLVVVEALMSGTPVVVSDAGELPELVDSRWVFRQGDIRELSCLLDELDGQAAQEAVASGFARASSFTPSRLAKAAWGYWMSVINPSTDRDNDWI